MAPLFLMWLTISTTSGMRSRDVCTFHEDSQFGGVFADCNGKLLSRIPDDFPPNTTTIDLGNNALSRIENGTFSYLDTLQMLSVSGNMIANLEVMAFTGCDTLSNLDLSNNQLVLKYSHIPREVFLPLKNLNWLNLLQNTLDESGIYPEEIFKYMNQLQTLKLDAIGEPRFGEGFKSLRSLKNLILCGEYCGITTLRNTTFLSFENITVQVLNITYCHIALLESGTFVPLAELQDLLMAFSSPVGVHAVFRSLSSFTGRRMRLLDLRKVHFKAQESEYNQIMDGIISDVYMKMLADICVKRVLLSRNNILYMNLTSLLFTNFSSCIEHVDVSVNRFHGDFMRVYIVIQTFRNLILFDTSNQETGLKSVFIPRVHHRYIRGTPQEHHRYITGTPHVHHDERLQGNVSEPMGLYLPYMTTNQQGLHQFTVSCPQRLQYLNFSAISGNFGNIRYEIYLKHCEFLTVFNISFLGFGDVKGHIAGLMNLKVLDMSGNEHMTLVDSFFDTFPALEHLYLKYFSVQQHTLLQQGRRLLLYLPKLKSLHLSFNRLTHLPSNLLDANPLLEHLDLSNNALTSIPFDTTLRLPPNLHVLNIAANSLAYLDGSSLDRLDQLNAADSGQFQLILRGNVFSCGCHNLVFLFWLKETKTHVDNDRNFTCLNDNGGRYDTVLAADNVEGIWRQCSGFDVFMITFSIFVGMVASLMLSMLVKTNHTALVYMFIDVLRKQVPKPRRHEYAYDLYLAYADAEDYQWICHHLRPALEAKGLRLFLWDRDSLPGDSISDQISESIARSWRILIYYTMHYDKDPYSYFSMMTAIRCVDSSSPDRLVLLLPEGEHPIIPRCLLQVVPENCILIASDTEDICNSLVDLVFK